MLFGRILSVLTPLTMVPSIIYCLMFTPKEATMGDLYRIIYFHIPCAWVATLAFFVSFIFSIAYLVKRKAVYDSVAHRSSEIGLVFCVLATITGSVFATYTWGSPWNWDPRETSIVFLLMIYIAYLLLRWLIEDRDKKAAISAGYSIVAFLATPFLVFVMPRITSSLHPEQVGGLGLTKPMLYGVFGMLAGFTFLYLWILSLSQRLDMEEI
ncbi:MAG: cytochrome c biogenesis protein CcsA [Caldisericales bacterium]|nr:cytochrome c biogenesis protein CcsA [Caldisericia bacterium]NMD14343.1 cytochrome c biogenesis protein CcsA [Caldisericales bacterium]